MTLYFARPIIGVNLFPMTFTDVSGPVLQKQVPVVVRNVLKPFLAEFDQLESQTLTMCTTLCQLLSCWRDSAKILVTPTEENIWKSCVTIVGWYFMTDILVHELRTVVHRAY